MRESNLRSSLQELNLLTPLTAYKPPVKTALGDKTMTKINRSTYMISGLLPEFHTTIIALSRGSFKFKRVQFFQLLFYAYVLQCLNYNSCILLSVPYPYNQDSDI